MKVIQKALSLDREEYFKKHLEIINPILPVQLTPKEIEVLATFMSFTGELVEEDRFNSIVRKKVMAKNKISDGGLGNYLNSMIKKGFLTKHEITKRIKIKPFLFPEEGNQGYQFKITMNGEDSGTTN